MDDRQRVLQAAEARARALAEGDALLLRDLLHEDFHWTSHVGDTFGREDYIRRNTTGAVQWRSQEFRDIKLVVVGDTAVLHAEVTDIIDSGSRPETFRMPMTQVWVRQGERWRCLAGHAGPRQI